MVLLIGATLAKRGIQGYFIDIGLLRGLIDAMPACERMGLLVNPPLLISSPPTHICKQGQTHSQAMGMGGGGVGSGHTGGKKLHN